MPVKEERKFNLSISYMIWTGNHKFGKFISKNGSCFLRKEYYTLI